MKTITTSTGTRIVLFAKAPTPGSTKTRLIPLLGAEPAAKLHALLIERALRTALAAAIGPVELWCAPSAQHPRLRDFSRRFGIATVSQCDGDLGARMLHAAVTALADAPCVIIIGSDCPALTLDHLRQADTALRAGNDAVLTPTEDGGYALLGLARWDAQLFENIDWGSNRVLAITRERLATLDWRWSELPATWDVDRPDDYRRLVASGLMPGLERQIAVSPVG